MKVSPFYQQYLEGLRSVVHLLDQILANDNRDPACDSHERLRLLFEDVTVTFNHVMECMQAQARLGGLEIDGELDTMLDECCTKLALLRERCAIPADY
jgi:hypothetical protein